jgi:hypothetical protein
MPGVRQKPITALAFKRGGRGVVPVIPPPPLVAPEPPEEVGDYAMARWAKFWTTNVSGVVNMNRDGERLYHWCRCIDVREKLWNDYRMVAHPKWQAEALRQIRYISHEIDEAEKHFGMNPLDAMRLTGALDQAEAAETNITKRRERRKAVEA